MTPRTFIQSFRDGDDGAVTVDWVVLVGGVLIFGMITAGYIARGATDTSNSVGARLGAAEVPQIDFDGS